MDRSAKNGSYELAKALLGMEIPVDEDRFVSYQSGELVERVR